MQDLFTGRASKWPFVNTSTVSTNLAIPGVIHMRSPWTLSTIETAIFIGLMLGLAGADLGLGYRLRQPAYGWQIRALACSRSGLSALPIFGIGQLCPVSSKLIKRRASSEFSGAGLLRGLRRPFRRPNSSDMPASQIPIRRYVFSAEMVQRSDRTSGPRHDFRKPAGSPISSGMSAASKSMLRTGRSPRALGMAFCLDV